MDTDRLAFMIGLLGSIHCIGMCGPLAFAVPSVKEGGFYLILDKLLYQFGRIISYCMLGLIIGLIGRQIWLAGFQQGFSILSGVLIIAAACFRIFKLKALTGQSAALLKPFYKLFNIAMKHKANHLIIGMINGFLPCGFVYLAMAGALNTGEISSSVIYMFWFGLGTLPLMFIATIGMGFTGAVFRRKINKIVPFMMLFLGIWFIFKGLELNIPYLSPAKMESGIVDCR